MWVFNIIVFSLVCIISKLFLKSITALISPFFWYCDTINISSEKPAIPAFNCFALPHYGWGLTLLSYNYWMYVFCPFTFASYLFNLSMILREYYIVEFELIPSTIFYLPTKWSTCSSLFIKLVEYFGGMCAPSISAAAKMYSSLLLRRLVGIPTMLLVLVNLMISQNICILTFPDSMRSHRCFREVHLIVGNI